MSAISPERWQALSAHLDALLTLPPLERSQRLDQIAANDSATAGDLRALLAARDSASRAGFLHGVAEAALLPAMATAGDVLGAWTLVEPIGEGGMGSVWRARRTDGRFEGEAAVKLLRSGLFDSAAQERFRREGAILARLQHPGIARLLDAGITARGQPYLVLELVQGEAIDRWCETRALSVRQRVDLFLQVTDAVAAAHGQLVIHRDLKPSNILVDAEGRARLLDFGIARLQAADGQADVAATALTREGALAMTPEYAAPEQFEGGTLSTATDVYALGIVLYKLLTGSHPSGLPSGSLPLAYLRAALDSASPLASRRAPHRQRALAGDIDNILAQALRATPEQRYATVTALADDLRRHLAWLPVQARPDTLAYRATRFLQRHRAGSALGAVALLAVLAGVVGTGMQARRAEREAERARIERNAALAELDHSQSTTQFLSYLLSEGGDKPQTAAELLGRASTMIERQFGNDTSQRARLKLVVAAVHGELGDVARALPLMAQARRDAEQAGDAPLARNIACNQGLALLNAGDVALALQTVEPAIAAERQRPDPDTALLAACLASRAQIRHGLADGPGAISDAREAIRLLTPPRAGQRLLLLNTRGDLAAALNANGQYMAAAEAARQVLADLKAIGRAETSMAVVNWHNLGTFLSNAGQDLSATQAYETAAVLERRIQGRLVDPQTPGILADQLAILGRLDEALPLADESIELARKQPGSNDLGWSLLNAASVYREAGNPERAQQLLEEARKTLAPTLKAGHPTRALLEMSQGRIHLARQRLPEALQNFRRAEAIYESARLVKSGRVRGLLLLARAERLSGDLMAARGHLMAATDMLHKLIGNVATSTPGGLVQLESAQQALAAGDRIAAATLARRAREQLLPSVGPRNSAAKEALSLEAQLRPTPAAI
jgi:serine/threonine-protein kinase